jgi:hypothetical protein
MKYPRARNSDERWSRETTAMALGLSTMGISLLTSQLVRRPEIAVGGAALAFGLTVWAWPRGER